MRGRVMNELVIHVRHCGVLVLRGSDRLTRVTRTFDLRDDVFRRVLTDDIRHARDDCREFVEIGHIGALGRRLGVFLHY